MTNIRQIIINKTNMTDDDFYKNLMGTHLYMRSLMNEFERELYGDNRTDYLDTLYEKLNIMVQRFDSNYKVKYNYDLDKLKNIE